MSQDSAPTMYPVSGEVLKSRYEIKDVLGEGGMGAVAKGWDRNLNRYVAVKFMSPALVVVPGAVERFIMEGKAAAQLEDTDHVVRFYDDGVLPNHTPFLVMEFLDGRDLSGLIEKEGIAAISVPRAIHFILQVLRGLQVAHAKGIIHRDIKPSNCFVVHREGEDDFIKIVDFGISKFQKESGQPSANLNLTKTNSALGTPLYMSPEQAKSPKTVDHRSDLYSVSCILYELLTGQTPYLSETGEFADILVKLLTQEPEPLAQLRPDLPPGLAEVVHTGLAKEREDRYITALEFAEALAPYADPRSDWVLKRIRTDKRRPNDSGRAPAGSIAPPPTPGIATVRGFVPARIPNIDGSVAQGGQSGKALTPQEMVGATIGAGAIPGVHAEGYATSAQGGAPLAQKPSTLAASTVSIGGPARSNMFWAVPFVFLLGAGGVFFAMQKKNTVTPVSGDLGAGGMGNTVQSAVGAPATVPVPIPTVSSAPTAAPSASASTAAVSTKPVRNVPNGPAQPKPNGHAAPANSLGGGMGLNLPQ